MSLSRHLTSFLERSHENGSAVYGRICTTADKCRPEFLSDTPDRSSVFLFGPSTVKKVLDRPPYDLLVDLGLLPEYIHSKACIQEAGYWLVLLKHHEGPSSADLRLSKPSIVPATWDGVLDYIGRYYPTAKNDVLQHWDAVLSRPIEHFEEQAGFKFIKALENVRGPLFMSYAKFCQVDRPVTAWQARLFLYCELRVLELFKGDGFTYKGGGAKGDMEYLAPNLRLSEIREGDFVVIPLEVIIPEDVHILDDRCRLNIESETRTIKEWRNLMTDE